MNDAKNGTARSSLNDARVFMDAHLDAPLDLAQIAARANYSPYHFIRAFRKAFHETPHQYLIRKRLEKAKELLATTNLPVTEICFAVGFESLGSFSALFQKRVGWAPTVYRARAWEMERNPFKFIPGCYRQMFHITKNGQ